MKKPAFRTRRSRRLAGLAAAAALLAGLGALAAASSSSTAPGGNPLGQLTRSAADEAPLVGRVEERIPAGSYTYLDVRREDGSRFWAVTLGGGAPQGASVKIRSFGRRADFRSARLQRTFSELVFGAVSRLD